MSNWWTKTVELEGKQVVIKRNVDKHNGYVVTIEICAIDFLPDSEEQEVSFTVTRSRKPLGAAEFDKLVEPESIKKIIVEYLIPFLEYLHNVGANRRGMRRNDE